MDNGYRLIDGIKSGRREEIKIADREEVERLLEKGKVRIEYDTEWAKDEDGIARPVGTKISKYYAEDGTEIVLREDIRQIKPFRI